MSLLQAGAAAGGADEAAWFQYGGNTYVVADVDAERLPLVCRGSSALDQNSDLVVKLTGLIDLTADATGVTLA